MISKSLDVFAKDIGIKTTDNCAFGIFGGFFVSIYEAKSKKIVKFSCFIGNNEDYGDDYIALNDGFRDVIEKFFITDYSVKEDGIDIVTNGSYELINELLEFTVGLLNENEIPDSSYCSHCGEKIPEGEKRRIVTISSGKNEKKSLLCQNCALAEAEKNQSVSEESDDTKADVKKGIIASLLASVLVAVVYAFIFYITSTDSRDGTIKFAPCLFAFFIGGIAFVVYKLASKKITVKGVVGVCLVSTLSSFIAHYFGSVFGFASYVNETDGLTFAQFKNSFSSFLKIQFSDTENLRFLIIGGIVALCAAFIAIILLYGYETKKNDELKKIKVSIQTVK